MANLFEIIRYYKNGEKYPVEVPNLQSLPRMEPVQPQVIHHHHNHNHNYNSNHGNWNYPYFVPASTPVIVQVPTPIIIETDNCQPSRQSRRHLRDPLESNQTQKEAQQEKPEPNYLAGAVFFAVKLGCLKLLGETWAKYNQTQKDLKECEIQIRGEMSPFKRTSVMDLKQIIQSFKDNHLQEGLTRGSVALGSCLLAAKYLIPLGISATPWLVLVGLGVGAEVLRYSYWNSNQSHRFNGLDNILNMLQEVNPPPYNDQYRASAPQF